MKKLIVFTLTTVITQQVLAENWVQVAENTGGTGYIDFDSVQKEHLSDGTPVTTGWFWIKYKSVQDLDDNDKQWSNKIFIYFDCAARKWIGEHIIVYDKQGEVLTSDYNTSFDRRSSANWNEIALGTTGGAMLNAVCANTN